MRKIKSDRRVPESDADPSGQDLQRRLARIEGQVRGIAGMVSEGRYSVDVMTQVAAVQQALRQVSRRLLAQHTERCMREAFESGDEERLRELSREVAELAFKYGR